MITTSSRHVVLATRPQGLPKPGDFRIESAPVPELSPGQVLVRNLWMSVDPYMRGRMSDRKSYAPSFEVGKPMEGRAIGRVVRSTHPSLKEGAVVSSMLGWREYFVSSGEGLNPVDPSLPLAAYLGVLGIPGFTGWYGLKMIGKPKPGETLVVSGAAGATGSLVVQMGKRGRRHQLQEGGRSPGGAPPGLSHRHRHLFRERGRSAPRCRAAARESPRPHSSLRHDLAVQPRSTRSWSALPLLHDRQSRPHAGLHHL